MRIWARRKERSVPISIGVDGDGLESVAEILGPDDAVLGRATGGPLDAAIAGGDAAREALHLLLRSACAAARVDPQDVAAGCIGLTGAPAWAASALADLLGGAPCRAVERADGLFAAAELSAEGVVAAGALSVTAFGRDHEGRRVQAGGWGEPLTGAGGLDAAWRTLRAAVEAHDGRADRSPLRSGALAACEVADLVGLWSAVREEGLPPERVWRLVETSVAAAGAGDTLGKRVVGASGAEAAKVVVAALEGAGLHGTGADVALCGRLWSYGAFLESVRHRVRLLDPAAHVTLMRQTPAYALAHLARRQEER